jgi:hypothetical protein
MQFGAPAPRQRPQLIGLNLIPPERRRRVVPVLTIGLALVLLAGASLLYGAFYAKTYGDWEVAKLQTRIAQGQDAVRTASAEEAVASRERQRAQAVETDRRALGERQVLWSEVLSSVFSAPGGVDIDGVTQAGYTLTITGSAPDYDSAVAYLTALRATDYFLDLSIQVVGQEGPPVPLTPGPAPGAPPPAPAVSPATPTIPVRSATPPTPAEAATRQPTATQARTPVPASAPSPLPPATPAVTRTPNPTATTVRTPVPTPAFDYAVASTNQQKRSGGPSDVAYLRGKIVDVDGSPLTGLRVRAKTTDGGWQADSPTTTTGRPYFEFPVSRGSFSLQILDVRSETTGALVTGVSGSSDLTDFDVTFRKVPPFTPEPVVDSGGTPEATSTVTMTPTPLPTTVAPGGNIAPEGSVSVSSNPDEARLAIDNDINTVWNAKTYPVASIQVEFGTFRTIEGVEFVVSQVPAGSSTHELWVYDDTNTWVLERTFQSTTDDRQTIGYRFSPLRNILRVYIRTIRSPSFVAWREVRIFEAIPPPGGFPTGTPAPPTSTGTGTPTPSATATVTGTPPTGTATPTLTAGPTDQLDLIAVNSAAIYANPTPLPTPTGAPGSSCNGGLACLVDGQTTTAYFPPPVTGSAAWAYIPLDGANYISSQDSLARVDLVTALAPALLTATPSSQAFNIEVWVQPVGQSPAILCTIKSSAPQQRFSCIPATPIANAQWLVVGMNPPVTGQAGIAEVLPYKPRRPSISSPTVTGTVTSTPTLSPTPLTQGFDRVVYPLPTVATSSQPGSPPGNVGDGNTASAWFPVAGSSGTQYVYASLDSAGYQSSQDSVGAIELFPAWQGTAPATLSYIIFAVPFGTPTPGAPASIDLCHIDVPPATPGATRTPVPCDFGTPVPFARQIVVGVLPLPGSGTVDGNVGVAELAVYKVRRPVTGAVAGRGPMLAVTETPNPRAGAPPSTPSPPPRLQPGQKLSFVILVEVRSGVGYR